MGPTGEARIASTGEGKSHRPASEESHRGI